MDHAPSRERIGRANDVLVEETRAPDLAGNKSRAENADEEPAHVQAGGAGDEGSETDGDGAQDQQAAVGIPRAEPVTEGAGEQAHQQGR